MQTDPYTDLYHLIASSHNDTGIHLILGTVKTPEPLLVDVGGTDQEAERFYICDRLLNGHVERRDAKGALSISTACEYGSHSSMSVNGGVLTLTNSGSVLKVGDQVLLLTEDFQIFFLIDKVVHLL